METVVHPGTKAKTSKVVTDLARTVALASSMVFTIRAEGLTEL